MLDEKAEILDVKAEMLYKKYWTHKAEMLYQKRKDAEYKQPAYQKRTDARV